MDYQFSLVLPIQNQANIITPVVNNIISVFNQAKINYQIIMVENGSQDNTLFILNSIAKKNNRIKLVQSKSGYGLAVISGLNQANGQYLGYMPSDGQCDATILPSAFKLIRRPGIDLVKAYRISRESLLRTWVSKIFNLFMNLLFNLKTIDINASPTVFSGKNLKKLKLQSKDSFLDTELLIKARRFKWNIARLPMKNFKRSGGRSTVKPSIIIEFLKNILVWKINEFK